MPKKKVVIVGMLDSIHIARWVSQFVDSENDLLLFPSTHFKYIHRKLLDIENIRIYGVFGKRGLAGYVDSLVTMRFFGNRYSQLMRNIYLRILVVVYRPDIIHAIEIQHAGYLVSSIKPRNERRILTNWGSDIYFFQNVAGHERRIRRSLSWATHYSAECNRDYDLARRYGFSGIELPKIPNAGGVLMREAVPTEAVIREQLIIKCYGGTFGLGKMAISTCYKFLEMQVDASVFLYSVTEDLAKDVQTLELNFPGRVSYSTLARPLSHEALLKQFRKSRVYLGLSRSDGLSTSFLEALASGAYPIQTNTSCAGEFIELGAVGSIVYPEINEVLNVLMQTYGDLELLTRASKINLKIASEFLDYSKIKNVALSFYQ